MGGKEALRLRTATTGPSLYDLFMRPLEKRYLRDLRAWIIPYAAGEVLEIGAGTGANLPYYDGSRITRLVLTDKEVPRDLLGRRLRGNYGGPNSREPRTGLHFADADAENLPFPDSTFDSAVFTLVFCTVPDSRRGLREIRRVLRPRGRLIFIEHVRPEGKASARIFDRVTPAWKRIASGCHLNRRTVEEITEAGFAPREVRMRGVFAAGWAVKSDSP